MLLNAKFSILSGQYYGSSDFGNNNYYSHQSEGEFEQEEEDERPKVHLGFRLRVPAFRFELPRMQLPKITISAKIRQPDGPRTINLPEFNLDTSSSVAASRGSTRIRTFPKQISEYNTQGVKAPNAVLVGKPDTNYESYK